MPTEYDDNGRYAIVCDDCSHGIDTGALTQMEAYYRAGVDGWSISWPDGPDLCPICAERREEAVA